LLDRCPCVARLTAIVGFSPAPFNRREGALLVLIVQVGEQSGCDAGARWGESDRQLLEHAYFGCERVARNLKLTHLPQVAALHVNAHSAARRLEATELRLGLVTAGHTAISTCYEWREREVDWVLNS